MASFKLNKMELCRQTARLINVSQFRNQQCGSTTIAVERGKQ